MSASVKQFVERLARSELLSAEQLDSVGREFPAACAGGGDAEALAGEFVRREMLTPYQAGVLLEGGEQPLRIGEYEVLEALAAGGMGNVYRARHRLMKRVVAIKVLPRSATENERLAQRFTREVEVAARLTHPNIVTAYDAGMYEGACYLVMEYVDGPDLSTLLQRRGPLPPAKAVNCIVQAARGLAYAHEKGVVHRDVKPGNLLVDAAGTVKILDMGLASSEDLDAPPDRPAASGKMMGTVQYVAPEQAANAHAVDHRADIYSLGCTLYRLLTNRVPFEAETAMQTILAHREQFIPTLADHVADLPTGLQDVLNRMMAKDPDRRYQSAAEVMADLQAVVPDAADHLLTLEQADAHTARQAALSAATQEGLVAAATLPPAGGYSTETTGPDEATRPFPPVPPPPLWRRPPILAAALVAALLAAAGVWIALRTLAY
jgi:eukaryotic-like serine/threonine-protein kinase